MAAGPGRRIRAARLTDKPPTAGEAGVARPEKSLPASGSDEVGAGSSARRFHRRSMRPILHTAIATSQW